MEIIVTAKFNDDEIDTINDFQKILEAIDVGLYRLPIGVNATELVELLNELEENVKRLKGAAGIDTGDDED